MNLRAHLKRPPWRSATLLVVVLGLLALGYLLWSPGKRIQDGGHDLRTNAIWVQHGWLGDDAWFVRHKKDPVRFRNHQRIRDLADLLAAHGIKYVFPHACPCDSGGRISPVDGPQTERFLDHFENSEVIPWIGGVLDVHCFPESTSWRTSFISSTVDMLKRHPRLSGVQLNIEPMPSGNGNFLLLLDELRQAMPPGKIVSVAAYPPPTQWHPFPEVHWDESYFRAVAQRVDLIAPMMYDTGIQQQKFYRHLMSKWTVEVLEWSGDTTVLLGIPAYDDAGVGYHSPKVENLKNSLLGVHAGLSRTESLAKNYAGIAIYSEWEMDASEWESLAQDFGSASPETAADTLASPE